MHIFLIALHALLIFEILPGLIVIAFYYDKWANLLSLEKEERDTFSRVVGVFFWFLVVRSLVINKKNKKQLKPDSRAKKEKPKSVLQKA